MTAGAYPAGAGPAGYAPITSPGEVKPFAGAVAVEFDGATKDYVRDADGNWKAIHPVDQEVALALLIRKGSVQSAPDVGHTFRGITDLASSKLQADVDDRVNLALARPLARGDIQIDQVDVDASNRQLRIAVYYRNLRADPKQVLRRNARI